APLGRNATTVFTTATAGSTPPVAGASGSVERSVASSSTTGRTSTSRTAAVSAGTDRRTSAPIASPRRAVPVSRSVIPTRVCGVPSLPSSSAMSRDRADGSSASAAAATAATAGSSANAAVATVCATSTGQRRGTATYVVRNAPVLKSPVPTTTPRTSGGTWERTTPDVSDPSGSNP